MDLLAHLPETLLERLLNSSVEVGYFEAAPWTVRFVGENDEYVFGAVSGDQSYKKLYIGFSIGRIKQESAQTCCAEDAKLYLFALSRTCSGGNSYQ